jgi:protein-S-isoprenylcysteine O-methyltransferase Ste14
MGIIGLTFAALYLLLALVAPLFMTRRRTGASALRSTPGVGRVAQLLFIGGNVLIVAGPSFDLAVRDSRITSIDSAFVHAFGIVLASAALPLIVASRRAMGASWRVGVDVNERTALVRHGPFARVRHPIYTAMLLLAGGIALIVPNVLTVAALPMFWMAVEIQTRLIEDPYLRRTHPEFERYAEETGRFLPKIGRLSPRT